MNSLSIHSLQPGDIQPVAAAFAGLGWDKPASRYERCLAEQEAGQPMALVACRDDHFSGYLIVCWQAHPGDDRLPLS